MTTTPDQIANCGALLDLARARRLQAQRTIDPVRAHELYSEALGILDAVEALTWPSGSPFLPAPLMVPPTSDHETTSNCRQEHPNPT